MTSGNFPIVYSQISANFLILYRNLNTILYFTHKYLSPIALHQSSPCHISLINIRPLALYQFFHILLTNIIVHLLSTRVPHILLTNIIVHLLSTRVPHMAMTATSTAAIVATTRTMADWSSRRLSIISIQRFSARSTHTAPPNVAQDTACSQTKTMINTPQKPEQTYYQHIEA